ncbi:MAG TPA: hypothetical protein GXX15_06450 [Clostridia bacterium]|nr:hypothetical protein [Clostridia bacterium]
MLLCRRNYVQNLKKKSGSKYKLYALINSKTIKYVSVIILIIVLTFAENFLRKKLIKEVSPISDFIIISILGFTYLYLYNLIIHSENEIIGYALTAIILGIIYVSAKIFMKKYRRKEF